MKYLALVVVALVTLGAVSPVNAQYSSRGNRGARGDDGYRMDVSGVYGYAWTFSKDFYYGIQNVEADIDDSGYWGINVDFTLPRQPGKQLRLSYTRQDSDVSFRSLTDRTGGSMAVEYWQIGGIYGVQQGNAMPYGGVTLGATHFASDFRTADGRYDDDVWKFSMVLQFGAKIYTQGRLGFMVQGRLPFTFFNGGASLACGGGGCYTSVGGSGVTQIDLSAGLMLRL